MSDDLKPEEFLLKSSIIQPTKGISDRTFSFVFSSGDLDRDNDVIEQLGIEFGDFRKNPVLLWAHLNREPPVGRIESLVIRNGQLAGTVVFTPKGVNGLADTLHDMLAAGFPLATSIGFAPLEWTYDETQGGFIFKRIELYEISLVPVPSNRAALRLAAAAGGKYNDEMKSWAKAVLSNESKGGGGEGNSGSAPVEPVETVLISAVTEIEKDRDKFKGLWNKQTDALGEALESLQKLEAGVGDEQLAASEEIEKLSLAIKETEVERDEAIMSRDAWQEKVATLEEAARNIPEPKTVITGPTPEPVKAQVLTKNLVAQVAIATKTALTTAVAEHLRDHSGRLD